MEFKDLIGKTITNVQQKQWDIYDDRGFLVLTFSDNTQALLIGDAGGYTGKSLNEYQTEIYIKKYPQEQMTDPFDTKIKLIDYEEE